jgi:quaternary ammonium compound-resistance protein SugE
VLASSPDEVDPYQVGTTGLEESVAWLTLIIAGLLEVVWSLGLKYTHGFTRVVPSAITVVALIASVILLERAARVIPIGTAYAVWVGIGVVGAALGGAVLFSEAMPPLRIVFTVLLVVSIVGLKLTSH